MNPLPLSALARPRAREPFNALPFAVRRRFFLESMDAAMRAKWLELHPHDLARLQRAALKRARREAVHV